MKKLRMSMGRLNMKMNGTATPCTTVDVSAMLAVVLGDIRTVMGIPEHGREEWEGWNSRAAVVYQHIMISKPASGAVCNAEGTHL